MEKKYISCADTAKLLRAALKTAFPTTKFSVKSHVYSGGASIRVIWTDGPTSKQVEGIANNYQGADFDGMQDLKTYRTAMVDGQPVRYGADYIFCNRELSQEFRVSVARRVAANFWPAKADEWAEAALKEEAHNVYVVTNDKSAEWTLSTQIHRYQQDIAA